MRRAVLLATVVLLAAAAPTASHPGHGLTRVSVGDQAFAPATVEVVAGDAVQWTWDGLVRDHSVTADDGSFDSDPDGPPRHGAGDSYVRAFPAAGTFAYHCKVHPRMRGTVVVRPAVSSQDTTPPRLGRPRAVPSRPCLRRGKRCRRPGLAVRFTLDEPADVLVEARRTAGRRADPVATRTVRGRAGRNVARLPARRLRPGRHRIDVIATDEAGNIAARSVTVRLRR